MPWEALELGGGFRGVSHLGKKAGPVVGCRLLWGKDVTFHKAAPFRSRANPGIWGNEYLHPTEGPGSMPWYPLQIPGEGGSLAEGAVGLGHPKKVLLDQWGPKSGYATDYRALHETRVATSLPQPLCQCQNLLVTAQESIFLQSSRERQMPSRLGGHCSSTMSPGKAAAGRSLGLYIKQAGS